MKDKIFLDTNILVYCYSNSEPSKREIAQKLCMQEDVYISTQVLNEMTNVLAKKHKISWNNIANVISEFESNFFIHTLTSFEIKKACNIAEKYGFSYFDSLIIASAIEANCNILYSEDMHNGQVIENKIKIINPFLEK